VESKVALVHGFREFWLKIEDSESLPFQAHHFLRVVLVFQGRSYILLYLRVYELFKARCLLFVKVRFKHIQTLKYDLDLFLFPFEALIRT